jgi:hypothetical protein
MGRVSEDEGEGDFATGESERRVQVGQGILVSECVPAKVDEVVTDPSALSGLSLGPAPGQVTWRHPRIERKDPLIVVGPEGTPTNPLGLRQRGQCVVHIADEDPVATADTPAHGAPRESPPAPEASSFSQAKDEIGRSLGIDSIASVQ